MEENPILKKYKSNLQTIEDNVEIQFMAHQSVYEKISEKLEDLYGDEITQFDSVEDVKFAVWGDYVDRPWKIIKIFVAVDEEEPEEFEEKFNREDEMITELSDLINEMEEKSGANVTAKIIWEDSEE